MCNISVYISLYIYTFQLVHYTACIQNSEIYISSYTSYIYIYTYIHVLFVYMYRIPGFFVYISRFSNVFQRWGLLPLIEAFFVLHGRVPEGMMNPTDPASPNPASPEREDGKVSNVYLVFRGKRREGLLPRFQKKHFRNQWWHQCWFFIRNLDSRMEMDGNGAY